MRRRSKSYVRALREANRVLRSRRTREWPSVRERDRAVGMTAFAILTVLILLAL